MWRDHSARPLCRAFQAGISAGWWWKVPRAGWAPRYGGPAATSDLRVIIGVGGGVGGAVAQIAKARGCRVIGVDQTPPPADSPASRLIDEWLLFDDSMAKRANELTKGGADVVFDAVGGIGFEAALHMAKRRGRVVEISAVGKRRVEFDLIEFYHNETQLFGADSAKLGVVESARIMLALKDEFDKGLYQAPLIAQRFPLEAARQAYQAVAAGAQGRVVVNI